MVILYAGLLQQSDCVFGSKPRWGGPAAGLLAHELGQNPSRFCEDIPFLFFTQLAHNLVAIAMKSTSSRVSKPCSIDRFNVFTSVVGRNLHFVALITDLRHLVRKALQSVCWDKPTSFDTVPVEQRQHAIGTYCGTKDTS